MAWYNPGGGAGVWDAATVEPDLRNIIAQLCWAVNERELITGTRSNVTSITRSGSTATVTTATHSLSTGDYVLMIGADDSEYNGLFQVTVTSSTTFTYTVSGSPTSPATGTIKYCKTATSFTYNEDFDTKKFPVAADFDGLPLHKVSDAPELTLLGLTRSGATATARVHGHGLMQGHYVTISGASQSEYNGEHAITAIPTYAVSSITRSGGTATVTVSTPGGHNLATGDYIVIVGADQPAYNIVATATVLDTTRFTYSVSGSPATPATGSISMIDQSRFQFDVDSGATTPATGTIKAVSRASMIYKATWSGGTARIFCKQHGFSVGQWIEVVAEDSFDTDWQFWGPVTAISSGEWFEIAHAGTLDSELNHGLTGRAFWCSRVIGVRKPLKELQDAIDGLLGRTILFATNSSPYTTAYTTSSLLGAGSYGSSWLSLMGRATESIGDAVLQMREALDQLVYTTVSETTASGNNTAEQGYLFVGSVNANPHGYTTQEFWDGMLADLGKYSGGSGSDIYIGAGAPSSESEGFLYRTGGYFNGQISGVECGVSVATACDIVYTITPMIGTFVKGFVYFTNEETGNKTQDEYDITDDDGDVISLDAGGSPVSETVEKSSAFFSSTSHTLTFQQDTLPSTETMNVDTTVYLDGHTNRCLKFPAGARHRHTRQLVPGTHLTYG